MDTLPPKLQLQKLSPSSMRFWVYLSQCFVGLISAMLWLTHFVSATGEFVVTYVPKSPRRKSEELQTVAGKYTFYGFRFIAAIKNDNRLILITTHLLPSRTSVRHGRGRSIRRSQRTSRSADTYSDSLNSYSISDPDR